MRRLGTLALLALLVAAGCLGTPGAGGASDAGERPDAAATIDATPTERPDTTPTERSNGTATPASTAASPTATAANTLAYGNLTERERRVVRAAVDGTVRFAPDSPFLDVEAPFPPEVEDRFRRHEYVRWNGTHYRIGTDVAGGYAVYGVRVTARNTTGNATVVARADLPSPSDESVVNVSTLPPAAREGVRAAIENGSYTYPAGRQLPEALRETEYVHDGRAVYRLGYVVGDAVIPELRLRPVG